MKRLLILTLALLGTHTLSAQSVEVGAHAPRIRGVEWISDEPEKRARAMMVEFFHSTNEDCREHIDHLNALASDFRYEMDVVVLTREPSEQVAYMLLHEYQFFYVATDERGDMFRSFGVNHVPYAVIINPRGIIIWVGNPLTLDKKMIKKLLQQK